MNWDDELSWIKEYRFPLYSKCEEPVTECLKKWMKRYDDDLSAHVTFMSQAEKQTIEEFGANLLEAQEHYLQCEYAEAFTSFNAAMDDVKDSLPTVYIGREHDGLAEEVLYYRVCAGDNDFTYQQCLHIPYKKRQLASTNRFSAPGMPCSYMASRKEIGWFECGMPNVYQLAEYRAVEQSKKLLRLDINPLTDTITLINLGYNRHSDDDIKSKATKLCYVLPLIASCSVVAKNKEKAFVEAYIIPQMLMAWIKTCTDYVGVRYNPSVDNILVRNNCGYNIALPASDPDEDGYSRELMRIFEIKDKKEKRADTINTVYFFVTKNSKQIEELNLYCDKVQYTKEHTKRNRLYDICDAIHPICYTFVTMLDSYTKGTANESYDIVVVLSQMWGWSSLVLEKVEKVVEQAQADESLNKPDLECAKKMVEDFKRCVVDFAHDIFSNLNKGGLWDKSTPESEDD